VQEVLDDLSVEFPDFRFSQKKNKCKNKFITITVANKRMSGEVDTSLGNGIANLINFEACLELLSVRGDIVVEGDDGLFRVDGDLMPTNELYRALGWIIDIVYVDDISKASFCGMLFDPGDQIIVTDPRKVMATVGMLPEKYYRCKASKKKQLIRARGFSLHYQYGSCPIVGAIGRYLLRTTRSINMTGFFESRLHAVDLYEREKLKRAMTSLPERCEPGMATRLLVEELYGITVQEQLAIEKYYDSLTDLHVEINFDWLRPDFFPSVWSTYAANYAVLEDTVYPEIPLSRLQVDWEDIVIVEDDGVPKAADLALGKRLDILDLKDLDHLTGQVERSLNQWKV